jgi:RND family efflux transporter MFP subunit
MNKSKYIVLAVLIAVVGAFVASRGANKAPPVAGDTSKPALTVTTVTPETVQWSERVTASGPVLAWQEAIIGAEIGGVRLVELQANIGDRVKKGDLLARLSDEMLLADVHQQQASFDESAARYKEAEENAQRAAKIKDSGVLSAQESRQFSNAAEIAKAQMGSADARLESAKLKLRYTQIVAPDDGLISARNATVGTVAQVGAEMFRLIRQDKLEWRAELNDAQLQQVRIGQRVKVRSGANDVVQGEVIRISPSVDMTTRNGYVYIALSENKTLRAGTFTEGEFELGRSDALTLPQSAVVIRDGYTYVYRVGEDARVTQTKVTIGRRQGDRVEVSTGLAPDAAVVASGTGFLNDGDLVRVEVAKTKFPAATAKSSTHKSNI